MSGIPSELLDVTGSVKTSWENWLSFRKPDMIVKSVRINAPIEAVVAAVANPHNEHWYPTKKGTIKLTDYSPVQNEPEYLPAGYYSPAHGQIWYLETSGLKNEMSYHFEEVSYGYIVRLMASPQNLNEITWVVFYHVKQLDEGVQVIMYVFFIGLPKIGVHFAPKWFRSLLGLAFRRVLNRGLSIKLKAQCEALA